MAINLRIGTKINKNLRRDEFTATRVDPYPYLGIVMNNVDPAKSGRLQVWIPDFGGEQDNPSNWRTVSYASPFMGSTYSTESPENTFTTSPHTYGMWMVPPDLAVEVIVIFVGGDPQRGFWIACVNSHLSRHMMPGLASSSYNDISPSGQTPRVTAPVIEFNEQNTEELTSDFTRAIKPVHKPQYDILKEQGLDRDTSRGTITSSSQRESPSNVFGISTPGRPYYENSNEDPAVNPTAYLDDLKNGKITEEFYKRPARVGGHTFVMDDGHILGKDQLVRLRTAGGHQLMMNDTDNTLYISHKDGTSWIELTAGGAVNIFANSGFNVRSKGTINLHSDNNININAANKLNLYAGSTAQLDAGTIKLRSENSLSFTSGGATEFKSGTFNVDAAAISFNSAGDIILVGSAVKTNSGAGKSVKEVKSIARTAKADSIKNEDGFYEHTSGRIDSIVTVMPTHEPFNRDKIATDMPPVEFPVGTGDTNSPIPSNPTITPGDIVTDEELRRTPDSTCTIGPLTSLQLTAYFAQLGKRESSNNYASINPSSHIGKYQFGAAALQQMGYITHNAVFNSIGKALDTIVANRNTAYAASWAKNKNGMDSREKFLKSPDGHAEQELAICAYTEMNYKSMIRNTAIRPGDTAEHIGGMLAVAHLLGPGRRGPFTDAKGVFHPNGSGAWKYSRTGEGKDGNDTSGETYFQLGRLAVGAIAPKLAALNAADTATT